MIPFVMTEFNQTHWTESLDQSIMLGLMFSIILATVIAHSLFTFGIKHIKASEIGIYSYIDPIAAIVVAYYLLNEQISLPYLMGAFLVFVGLFIAQGRINYHPFHKLFN